MECPHGGGRAEPEVQKPADDQRRPIERARMGGHVVEGALGLVDAQGEGGVVGLRRGAADSQEKERQCEAVGHGAFSPACLPAGAALAMAWASSSSRNSAT